VVMPVNWINQFFLKLFTFIVAMIEVFNFILFSMVAVFFLFIARYGKVT